MTVATAADSTLCQARKDEAPKTFEELYRDYYRHIYNKCYRMLCNAADAEDMAQETVIQAQKKLDSFNGNAAFTSWLHRVTINQVLMSFRKKRLHTVELTPANEVDINNDYTKDNGDNIINILELEKAVEKLPPGYRQIFLLHDVEGYEHKEIANMLGITTGTTKSQLHKARLRLRELLCNQTK